MKIYTLTHQHLIQFSVKGILSGIYTFGDNRKRAKWLFSVFGFW